MAFSPQEYKNPMGMFEIRTRQVRVRIQNLERDLMNVQSPFSKAIIQKELDRLVDDYIERKSVLEREERNHSDVE